MNKGSLQDLPGMKPNMTSGRMFFSAAACINFLLMMQCYELGMLLSPACRWLRSRSLLVSQACVPRRTAACLSISVLLGAAPLVRRTGTTLLVFDPLGLPFACIAADLVRPYLWGELAEWARRSVGSSLGDTLFCLAACLPCWLARAWPGILVARNDTTMCCSRFAVACLCLYFWQVQACLLYLVCARATWHRVRVESSGVCMSRRRLLTACSCCLRLPVPSARFERGDDGMVSADDCLVCHAGVLCQ
jgi:hypothetical protein